MIDGIKKTTLKNPDHITFLYKKYEIKKENGKVNKRLSQKYIIVFLNAGNNLPSFNSFKSAKRFSN